MKYLYLLFDADDTLFDFSKASSRAFSIMCRENEIPDTPEVFRQYEEINRALWNALDRGDVTKEFIVQERYVRLLRALALDRSAEKCNRDYLAALAESVFPLPDSEFVCRTLAQRGHQLYLVTNAVASVQRKRLELCTFGSLFQGAFISEEAGAAKPNRAYFDYVRSQVPGITAENTLVIGDSPASDIKGANNAGLPCCWFNPHGKTLPEGLHADYEIASLPQLLDIV